MDDHYYVECFQKYSTLKFLLVVVTFLVLVTQTTYSEMNTTTSIQEVFIGEATYLRSGIVELSFDGVTRFRINPDYDEWEVASVVCRHKGFGPPSIASVSFTTNKKPQILISCDGDEMTLSECQFETNSTFRSAIVLRVSCLPAWSEEFEVVLVQKYTFLDAGYVLTFVDGQWGPICTSRYPNSKICRTICRQLGYRSCQDYPTLSFGVEINELPALGELECGNNADSLKACRYRRLQNQSCKYPEDEFLYISCSASYDDNDHYEPPTQDTYGISEDHRVIANGQVMAVIAFVVTTFLCVMFYLCRKGQAETIPTASNQTQQNLGGPVASDSLLRPSCHSAVIPGTTPGSEAGLYPLQRYHVSPPHINQPDISSSPSYPIMAPPPVYQQNATTHSEGLPPATDADLPTYEEAVANKIDL